jgi:hypothetical protein
MAVALIKLSNARPLAPRLVLSAVLLAMPAVALPQEAGPAPAQEQPPVGDQNESAGDGGAAEPGADRPISEVFIPTEEISEDFAVSFPVDI